MPGRKIALLREPYALQATASSTMLHSPLINRLCRLGAGAVAVEAAAAARGAADARDAMQKQHAAVPGLGVAAAVRGAAAPSRAVAQQVVAAAPADAAGWALWPLSASRGVLSCPATQHPAA